MAADEYTIYSMLILLADWRTGVWFGSAGQLGKIFHWSARRCQRLLKRLRDKKYISGEYTLPTGSAYSIKVERYFSTRGASVRTQGVRPQGRRGTSVGATSIEVLQEVKHRNPSARTSRRFPFPFRGRSNAKDLEGIVQIETQGPPRKDYLEFKALYDGKKLPKGMNWEKWQKLTPEERRKLLAA